MKARYLRLLLSCKRKEEATKVSQTSDKLDMLGGEELVSLQ